MKNNTEPCPNCKEAEDVCACLRNKCHLCGNPVGNITFTICDDCWGKEFPQPILKKQVKQMEDLNILMINFLREHERWEADVISEDKLWWPHRVKDVLRGPIYDKMLELQTKRNELLKRLTEQ